MAKNWNQRVSRVTFPKACSAETVQRVKAFLMTPEGERWAQEVLNDPGWQYLPNLAHLLAESSGDLSHLTESEKVPTLMRDHQKLFYTWQPRVTSAPESKEVEERAPIMRDGTQIAELSPLETLMSQILEEIRGRATPRPTHMEQLLKEGGSETLSWDSRWEKMTSILCQAMEATEGWLSPWSWGTYLTRSSETQRNYQRWILACDEAYQRLSDEERSALTSSGGFDAERFTRISARLRSMQRAAEPSGQASGESPAP
jgi:hypothetical protein